MNTIENTLKKLSMLYEFNRKLRTFTTSTKDNQTNQAMEPAVAPGRKQKPITK
jgi:hypothetical protein